MPLTWHGVNTSPVPFVKVDATLPSCLWSPLPGSTLRQGWGYQLSGWKCISPARSFLFLHVRIGNGNLQDRANDVFARESKVHSWDCSIRRGHQGVAGGPPEIFIWLALDAEGNNSWQDFRGQSHVNSYLYGRVTNLRPGRAALDKPASVLDWPNPC